MLVNSQKKHTLKVQCLLTLLEYGYSEYCIALCMEQLNIILSSHFVLQGIVLNVGLSILEQNFQVYQMA